MSEAEKTHESRPRPNKRGQQPLFEFNFNRAVKLRKQTANASANTGVLLLRETDHELGDITKEIASLLQDDRTGTPRYQLSELLRERTYAIAMGLPHQDDADFLAHDPAFKTAVWDRAGAQVADERLASQPTASRLITLLAQEPNLETLRDSLTLPIQRHQQADGGDARVSFGVIDIDGYPIETRGKQPGAVYNGYYGKTVYSPLAAFFSVNGNFSSKRLGEGFIHAQLRPGDAPPAGEAIPFIDRAVDKAKTLAQTVALRMDAGFAGSEVLNHVDRAGVRFTVRLPHNAAIDRLAQPYLVRPSGRPPKEGYERVIELSGYRNPKWDKPYRVLLVIVDKPRNGRLTLFPEYFFLVTNWPKESRSPEEILEHYRGRAIFEDRIGEWNGLGVKLSLNEFAKNEATLLLSMLSFNLLEVIRAEAESARDLRPNPPAAKADGGWDMGRFRNVLLKTGSVLSRSGRRLWFDLSEGVAPLWQSTLARIKRWRRPSEESARVQSPRLSGFVPAPAHAFSTYTPRF